MFVIYLLYLILEIILLGYICYSILKNKMFSLKVAVIYPIVIFFGFLFFVTINLQYGGYDLKIEAFLSSFTNVADLIQGKYNSVFLNTLYVNNKLAFVDYVGMFILSIFSFVEIAISIFKTLFLNLFRRNFFSQEITVIFGSSQDEKTFISNISKDKKHRKECVVILNKELENCKEERRFLSDNNVQYASKKLSSKEDFYKILNRYCFGLLNKSHLSKKKINFISFFEDDKDISNFALWADEYFKVNNLYTSAIRFIVLTPNSTSKSYINDLLYVVPVNTEDLTKGYKDSSQGHIMAINKYDLTSYKFILEHNFAKYVPENLLNDDCTIADNLKINLFAIGYGDTNKAVIRDILINTQFAKKVKTEGEKFNPISYRLNTTIYDKEEHIFSSELSNGLFKYDLKEYGDKNNFYDLPDDYISHITVKNKTSIEDPKFISDIYNQINDESKNNFVLNYFVISLGNDLTNTFMAKKLAAALIEIKNSKNVIFIKANTKMLRKEECKFNNFEFIFFGNNNEVLNYNSIINNGLINAAKKENWYYEEKKGSIELSWCSLSKTKQFSNIYSVCNLPFKMSLLKLKTIDIDAFKKRYDIRNNNGEYSLANYKKTIIEGCEILNPMDVLAYIEHERWIAFELSTGTLPMKKSLYKEDHKTRNVNECYHLNVATSIGLINYYEDSNDDVIKYDYTSMTNFVEHSENKEFFSQFVLKDE